MYLLLYSFKVFIVMLIKIDFFFYEYLFTKINIKNHYLFILYFSIKKSLIKKIFNDFLYISFPK